MDGLAIWVALAAAGGGFGGMVWAILVNRRTVRTQNTIMFVDRYRCIDEAAPAELAAGEAASLATLSPQRRRQVLASARSYFDLCSDEYALGTKNRIDQEVWSLWLNGLKNRMAQPIWQDCWRELEEAYRAKIEFWEFISMALPEFRRSFAIDRLGAARIAPVAS